MTSVEKTVMTDKDEPSQESPDDKASDSATGAAKGVGSGQPKSPKKASPKKASPKETAIEKAASIKAFQEKPADQPTTDAPASDPQKPKSVSKGIGSLVERVVEKTPQDQIAKPAGIGIGSAASRKSGRDPSAMGASIAKTPPPKPAFGGIGSSAARSDKDGNDRPKPAGLTSTRRKPSSIGAPQSADTADKLLQKGISLQPKAVPEKSGAADEKGAKEVPAADQNTPADKKADPAEQAPQSKPRRKSRPVEEIDLIALRDAGYITPDMQPNLMAEEFRIIKRSIVMNAFAQGENRIEGGNVIMVTSSNPSEGKTFCAINLALSIATEQDVTVLLIDADFSKPEILNRLGVSGGRGLMDVVADKKYELGDCLVRTNIPNLVLLPAGRQHNLTTELLASDRMRDMVHEISTRYPDRIVIFDSPPVLASSAASVMALYMGQTVFVIEAERTTEPQIKESLNMVSGCEHIALLLNKTKFGGSQKKFATYYGYGGR